MIIGHVQALAMAGLPAALRAILEREDCSLEALRQREDGRFQPEDAEWFCHIGPAQTEPAAQRHTEYHRQWADIQLVLEGSEIINASQQSLAQADDEERKADLFIASVQALPVSMCLSVGDFAVFLPGEPHQALCAAQKPERVRKAVFKIPRSLLEE
ncbi:YhcH/YjgK/YiaL family protein [Pantoea sp. ACRSB]|uniref:YhcH/YjgK/YiaL family protein n=1 Tax=Pantoea sp. ACRSB TaxID=2918207 RepID=UPI0028936056|nr:YhcH/YjgK/YiaL family protein [Pantoea sp. ACRSB]MCG7389781.1 YhcH/YjgK/YiaL family protein [Pantoea sp. ACRSB]